MIDFYQGEAKPDNAHGPAPPAFYLDVRYVQTIVARCLLIASVLPRVLYSSLRPALDSFENAYDRLRKSFHETLSQTARPAQGAEKTSS